MTSLNATCGDEIDSLITVTVDQSDTGIEMRRLAVKAKSSGSSRKVSGVREGAANMNVSSQADSQEQCFVCTTAPSFVRSTLIRRIVPAAILTILTVLMLAHDFIFGTSDVAVGSASISAIISPIKDELRRLVIQQLLGHPNTTSSSAP